MGTYEGPNMAKQRFSRAYHRYFEDYAERQIIDPNGVPVTDRVYVGKYYKVKLPDPALKRQRVVICLLYLAAAAAFALGGTRAVVSAVGYVAVLTMAALISLIWLAIPVFYRLTVPREMEIRSWRDSSQNLKRVSLGAAICLFICGLGMLSGALFLADYAVSDTIPCVVLHLLAGGLALGIHFLEKHTEYEILPPKNERPSMSSPIRYYSSD